MPDNSPPDAAMEKSAKGLHPVVKGVLWAWTIGLFEFAYFGLLLHIYLRTEGA